MPDYIILMHDDAPAGSVDYTAWPAYLNKLRATGQFGGGSSIGSGECVNKSGIAKGSGTPLTGYLRLSAASLADAKLLLAGNPEFDAGGTIEIRELSKD